MTKYCKYDDCMFQEFEHSHINKITINFGKVEMNDYTKMLKRICAMDNKQIMESIHDLCEMGGIDLIDNIASGMNKYLEDYEAPINGKSEFEENKQADDRMRYRDWHSDNKGL